MAPHSRSHGAPCSCFPKKVSLQPSSEQSVGDVRITQLDWKRVPQARSRGCKSSVAITTECSRHHASWNVSWAQRAPSAVGHETAVPTVHAVNKFDERKRMRCNNIYCQNKRSSCFFYFCTSVTDVLSKNPTWLAERVLRELQRGFSCTQTVFQSRKTLSICRNPLW